MAVAQRPFTEVAFGAPWAAQRLRVRQCDVGAAGRRGAGAAGVILLLGFPTGLFLLAPAFIASPIGGAVNAWLLLTRTTGEA